MSDKSRDLTPAELGCLNLLKIFDKACDAHKNTITIVGSKDAAEAGLKLSEVTKMFKILKLGFDKPSGKYKLTFTVHEFNKYTHLMLQMCGMTLLVDGRLKTSDNLYVPNDYLENKE